MDKENRAKEFIRRFHDGRPKDFFKNLDDKDKGLCLIMFMLADATGDVLAGDIATALEMSTPRVAAALNVLEKKGFVSRASVQTDRRKIAVCLTDAGRAEIEHIRQITEQTIEYLMETVGERDMFEFLRIIDGIKTALEKRENAISDS